MTFLGVLGIVTAVTYAWPRTYVSSATILVEKPGTKEALPTLDVLAALGRGSSLDTEVELLESRRVVEPVIDSLELHVAVETPVGQLRPHQVFSDFRASRADHSAVYRVVPVARRQYEIRDAETDAIVANAGSGSIVRFGGLVVEWPRTPIRGPLTIRVTAFGHAVAQVQERLHVSVGDRNSKMIHVDCDGSSPEDAHALCAAITERYVRLRTEMQRAEATATAGFLRQQVALLNRRLAVAEDSLEAFQRKSRAVAIGEQAAEEIRQFADFKAQREQLEAERSALARAISQVETGSDGESRYRDLASFPTFLKNPTVSGLMTSLVQLENRRSELAVTLAPENRELASVVGRIADIERELRSIAMNYESALASQIRSLDATLAGSADRMTGIPSQQIQSTRLERQVGLLGDLYRLLETRLREADVAEAGELPGVSIVDSASVPVKPSSPKVSLNLVLGSLLGLGLGLALAAYKHQNDTRIYEGRELARDTTLPVLAMIPYLRNPRPLVRFSVRREASAERLKRGRTGWLPKRWRDRTTTTPTRRGSGSNTRREDIALEAFRSLGVDLNFAAEQLGNGRVQSVAITSASRGEGKTFTACNLALARASHGVRTLLIDGDMRARGVSQFFGFSPADPGLSDVLTGRLEPHEAIQMVDVDNSGVLCVMPAGRHTSRSAFLLERLLFETVLQHSEEVFDLVVVDAPPLNVLTDAASIAARVDAVLLVVRGGVTDRKALELTLERLRRANRPAAGLVLNAATLPQQYVSYSVVGEAA